VSTPYRTPAEKPPEAKRRLKLTPRGRAMLYGCIGSPLGISLTQFAVALIDIGRGAVHLVMGSIFLVVTLLLALAIVHYNQEPS
jgi:hypothetical protein